MTTDKQNLAWLDGYRAALEGRARPATGPQAQAGWDVGTALLAKAGGGGGGGGYG